MNKDLLKNKKFLVVVAVAVVLLVLVVGFVMFKNSSSSNVQVNGNILPSEAPVPTISASELGLTLEAGPGGKSVILTVTKTDGISAIEYELSYISKGDIPRGAIGQMDLKKTPAVKDIILGTCSDVCHYDTEVKDIKILLKITKTDGSVFQSEATLDSL